MKTIENTANIMKGLVLCGGQSRRMGTDKGRLPKDNCTWAKHMSCKLEILGLTTYLSINSGQREAYRQIFPDQSLITDHIDIKGPLAGLLSAYQLFDQADFFVLPCDMIDVQITALQGLLDIRRQMIHADLYLYLNKGEVEPLCAIYSSSGLQKLYTDYQEGHLTNFSVKRAIKNLCTVTLNGNEKDFHNYNTPESILER